MSKNFNWLPNIPVAVGAIDKIDDYFGNRLILQLKPAVDKEALVSRENVSEFKKWMGK